MKQLMLVEDDEIDAGNIQRALKRVGGEVQLSIAGDGMQAWEVLKSRTRHTAPDLILLDINMPGKSGFDLLRDIRANTRLGGLPVVMLSTSDDPNDIEQAYELHAAGYLVKPATSEGYTRMVECLCRYWNTVKTPARVEPL